MRWREGWLWRTDAVYRRGYGAGMFRSLRLLVFVLTLGATVLVGCGSGSDDDGADTVDSSEPSTAVPTATDVAEPEPADATEPEPTAAPTVEPTAAPAYPDPEPPTAGPTRTTIDELLSRPGPLSIAHAGGDQDFPHSTPYAFDRAAALGADVLEVDVRLTADGVLVVHHDDTVDGTTGSTGLVRELTAGDLHELDNAYWFSTTCWPCRDEPEDTYVYRGVRTGERPPPDGAVADDFVIPTFASLVERFPSHAFDIEIKGSGEEAVAVAAALAAEVTALGIEDNVVVVSFDDAALTHFESLAPTVETSPGLAELTSWLLAGVPLEGHRIVQVPPDYQGQEVINEAFWEAAATADVAVWVWPSDVAAQENADFYRAMVAQGAHGIIAGSPTAMAEVTASS